VRLPIAATLADSPYAPADADGGRVGDVARLEGMRVLVVDDDADTCSVMSRILKETGAIVMTATDVGAALDELERFQPQVLVSDIGMPERDGYELIREYGRVGYFLPGLARNSVDRTSQS